MSERTLTITDNRTGKTYTLPIEKGTVRAMDLRRIKTGADDFGLMRPCVDEYSIHEKCDYLH